MDRRLTAKCFPHPRRRRWLTERLESRLLLSSDGLPADIHIVGTDGDDSAIIQTVESQLFVTLNGQTTEYKIDPGQKVHVDLLGGDNALQALITVDADWEFVMGDGNDAISVEALLGERSADSHYIIRPGEGDNKTIVQFGDGETGERLPTDESRIRVEYRSGAGADDLLIRADLSFEVRSAFEVDAFLGAGDDTATWDWHKKVEDHGTPASVDFNFDLGEGNDTVRSNTFAVWMTVGFFEVHGGDGDDLIDFRTQIEGDPEDQSPALKSNVLLDAGEGNDIVNVAWFDNLPAVDVGVDILIGQNTSFLPEVGDEVLIAFVHGDTAAPFVIGALWNGADKPPESENDAPAREFHLDVDTALPAVQSVRVATRLSDQKDTLALNFAGTLRDLQVEALLGGGNDTAVLRTDTTTSLTADPAVKVVVDAGLGGDTVDVDARGRFSRFTLNVDLGADPSGDDLPIESLTLNYENIDFDYIAKGKHDYKSDGSDDCGSVEFGWDLSTTEAGTEATAESDTSGGDVEDDVEITVGGGGAVKPSGTMVTVGAEDGTKDDTKEGAPEDASTAGITDEKITIHINRTESVFNNVQITTKSRNRSASRTINVKVDDSVGLFEQYHRTAEGNITGRLDVSTGAGDDLVDVVLKSSAVEPFKASFDMNVDLGAGDALLSILTLFPMGALEMVQAIDDDRRGHTSADFDLLLDGANLSALMKTGASDDTLTIRPLHQTPYAAQVRFDAGAGADRLIVDTSPLDVPTTASFSEVSGLSSETTVAEYRAGAEIGEHGKLQVDLSDLESFVLKTGDHPDEFKAHLDHPQPPVPELKIFTGDGDDRIAASFVGVLDEVVFDLDTGNGDDAVDVEVIESNAIVTGPGAGAGPHVKGFSGAPATETQSFFAYSPSFTGGVRVATGDINGDGVADIITGAGAGGGPHVRVFDGRSNAELLSFFAYTPSFTGGVYVAAGDVTGDGRADIITGVGGGASPHVKVFDGRTGAEVRSFFAFDPAFSGGVRVAAGDVNGDGRADIIVGAGPGAGPHVKVFDAITSAEIRSFFAYAPSFRGGVYVAAGDVNGDTVDDIITGPDAGVAPLVRVFDGTNLAALRSFFAYTPSFTGGVRVAAGDVNGDGLDDIVTGAGPGGGPHVKVFDSYSGGEIRSFFAYDPNFLGGVFVAANDVGRAGMFHLTADTAEGDDHVALDFLTGAPRVDLLDVEMGTGADNFALNWKGALQDFAVPQKIDVQVHFKGSGLNELTLDDTVGLEFIGGDIDRPIIIGVIGNPESLDMEIQSSGGLLGAQTEVHGGTGHNGMQLYFQGKLKVSSAAHQLGAMLDLGEGSDDVVLDFEDLELVGSSGAAPIRVDVRGGSDDDKLLVIGTNRADRIAVTDKTISFDALVDIGYDGFEDLRVNALAGDDTVTMTSFNPRTRTLLDGGPGRDRFTGKFDSDPGPNLQLVNFEITNIR